MTHHASAITCSKVPADNIQTTPSRWIFGTLPLLVFFAVSPPTFAQSSSAKRIKYVDHPTQFLPNADRFISKTSIESAPENPVTQAPPSVPAPSVTLSSANLRAIALVELADVLDGQRDPKAIEIYEQAAQAGSFYANYMLARHFISPPNRENKDVEKAISYYKKAAEGFAGAAADLGNIYLGESYIGLSEEEKAAIEREPAKAFYYLKKGADMTTDGNCPATLNALRLKVARMYAKGEGTPKNARLALTYFEKDGWIDENALEDYAILSDVYLRVARQEKDQEKATEYRSKAHEAALKSGFDPAFAISEWENAKSESSQLHPEKVIDYLRRASDLGNPDAQLAYATILLTGSKALVDIGLFKESVDATKFLKDKGISRNSERAIELLVSAAALGNADAQFQLGLINLKGELLTRNRTKALAYFEEAAVRGHSAAAFEAATLIEKGVEGANVDYEKASGFYEGAASQGNKDAQYQLALIYATGRGKDVNPNLSAKYYLQAASSGHEKARQLIVKSLVSSQNRDGANLDSQKLILDKLRTEASQNDIFAYSQALAESGDPLGQLALAQCYKKGIGIEKDPNKAAEIYLRLSDDNLKKTKPLVDMTPLLPKLQEAFKSGDLVMIKEFLKHNPGVAKATFDKDSVKVNALTLAVSDVPASDQRISVFKLLVTKGADARFIYTALKDPNVAYNAVSYPEALSIEELDFLLDAGADPNFGVCVPKEPPLLRLCKMYFKEEGVNVIKLSQEDVITRINVFMKHKANPAKPAGIATAVNVNGSSITASSAAQVANDSGSAKLKTALRLN